MFGIDIGVEIFHDIDVLKAAKDGKFKRGGPVLYHIKGKLLFEAYASIWVSANQVDPSIAHPLAGAGEVSHRAVEVGEGFTGNNRRRNHFLG